MMPPFYWEKRLALPFRRAARKLPNPMTEATDFLAALALDMPLSERLILCGFLGDPGKAEPRDWRPRPWKAGTEIPFEKRANGYVTVSSFGRAPDNTFRRRQGTFAAGRALMVDDVGTKVDRAVTAALKPSAIIETSKGNEQHWYFLSEPERDAARFDSVIRSFIAGKLLGADPGMAGITRVGRLPGYINGKPQHLGFVTRLVTLTDRRYTVADLLKAFDLKLEGAKAQPRRVEKDQLEPRIAAFERVEEWLKKHDMLKRREPDMAGWTEMHCPWTPDHTDEVDNGAAIREPMLENGFYGAFRCHHGHCQEKGWKDLTEWIASEVAVDNLERVNKNAPRTLEALYGRKIEQRAAKLAHPDRKKNSGRR